MNLCDTHSMPFCRLCSIEPDDRIEIPGSNLKAHPPKQKPRKEMKRSRMKRKSSKKVLWQEADPNNDLLHDLFLRDGRCFYADFAVSIGGEVQLISCDGETDPDHIIEQQWIRSRFPHGAWRDEEGNWNRIDDPYDWNYQSLVERKTLAELLAFPDVSVTACREHHRHKTAGKLIVPRTSLPDEVQDAIKAFGYEATLDALESRRGELERVA
jgi:hypothetical protein